MMVHKICFLFGSWLEVVFGSVCSISSYDKGLSLPNYLEAGTMGYRTVSDVHL